MWLAVGNDRYFLSLRFITPRACARLARTREGKIIIKLLLRSEPPMIYYGGRQQWPGEFSLRPSSPGCFGRCGCWSCLVHQEPTQYSCQAANIARQPEHRATGELLSWPTPSLPALPSLHCFSEPILGVNKLLVQKFELQISMQHWLSLKRCSISTGPVYSYWVQHV